MSGDGVQVSRSDRLLCEVRLHTTCCDAFYTSDDPPNLLKPIRNDSQPDGIDCESEDCWRECWGGFPCTNQKDGVLLLLLLLLLGCFWSTKSKIMIASGARLYETLGDLAILSLTLIMVCISPVHPLFHEKSSMPVDEQMRPDGYIYPCFSR